MAYVVNFLRATGIQKIYFNPIQTNIPTEIWAASWIPTDDTVTNGTLAAESMGDVNVYTYVKPMISILDCAGDGGYENSTASAFIAGTNCGGLTRITAIINKLNELPSGKRVFNLTRYNQGPFYDEVGDRFANGKQSPWAEQLGITLDSDVTTVFTRLGASGAIPDYIVLDCEQGSTFTFPYAPSAHWTAQVFGITGSANFTSSWYGMTSFNGLFTKDGQYSFELTNIVNGTFHPQNTRDYLFWDRAAHAIHATLLNKFIVEPVREIYPSVKISNYENYVIADGGTAGNAYDQNGHPIVREGIVGDAAAPVLYAGWGFPNSYGVYNDDTTKIVRTDFAGTTAFASNSWNHLLLLVQKLRAAKRSSPNTPLRPWIGSPNFVESVNGFDAKWVDSDINLGLYYESIKHFALTDVQMFNYFNSFEDTALKLTTACTRLESVLQEVNTLLGGYRLGSCITTDRIDFLTNYLITGAQTTRGTYLWRVTPKPGLVLETTDKFIVETDSDGGAWIETETSTPPGLTLTLGSQYAILRGTDITRRYYQYMFVATDTNTSNYAWDGWNYSTKAPFMGQPDPGSGDIRRTSRSYPFEYNPANPASSSPWHNILYEHFIESYAAGMRAISIHFPWGSAFSDKTWLLQPLDQLTGTTGFTFIYPRAGLCGYTNGYNSTTEPEWCQARIKGFTGAVKQLLDGTMTPSGRTAITDYCDVVVYMPGTNGWNSYRDFMHEWWTRSAGTSSDRDLALTARLDQMVDFVKSMKPAANKGLLSIGIDVGSFGATPENVHLYRTLSDYKSDICELANWYFISKLEDNQICVFTEARGVTQQNRAEINSNTGTTYGATGATGSSQAKMIVADENYFWYSDPDTAASNGDSYFANKSYIKNRNIGNTHRLSGSYLTLGSRLPWKLSTLISHAGFTMELYSARYADSVSHLGISTVYYPHYAMSHIYGCADVYMDYLYRSATYGNDIWGQRRAFKQFSTYALEPHAFFGFPVINQGRTAGGTTLGHDYTWWASSITNVEFMPLFDSLGFTTSAATKTPQGYPTTNYNSGFWTNGTSGFSDTKGWFTTNVKGSTFGSLIAVFKDLAEHFNPTGASDPPYWTGVGPEPSPYPVWASTNPTTQDSYWINTVDSLIR